MKNEGMKKLKYIVDIQKGKVPKKIILTDTGNLPIYLAMDYLRDEPKYISFVPDYEKYVLVDKNEILLLWDGSNAGEFMWSKKGILSSTMAVIKPKIDINKSFLFYQFKELERYLKDITVGMGIPHVNPQEFFNYSFFIPSFQKQTAIANYLDRKTAEIDELISQKEQLLKLYEEEKTAIINQAVTKGINNEKLKMKNSGIDWLGDIPEHWEVKKLKYLLNERLKYGANESALDENRKDPRYIRITDFSNYGKLRKNTFKSLSFEVAKDYLLKQGDILFARSGATVGKTFQFKDYNGMACFAGYLIKASPNDKKVISDFLYLFTKSSLYERWKESIFNQATIQNIGADKYAYLNIPFPKIKEQTEIVNYIETETIRINTKAEKTKKLIELLGEYKQSLISEVVTGKIKVI